MTSRRRASAASRSARLATCANRSKASFSSTRSRTPSVRDELRRGDSRAGKSSIDPRGALLPAPSRSATRLFERSDLLDFLEPPSQQGSPVRREAADLGPGRHLVDLECERRLGGAPVRCAREDLAALRVAQLDHERRISDRGQVDAAAAVTRGIDIGRDVRHDVDDGAGKKQYVRPRRVDDLVTLELAELRLERGPELLRQPFLVFFLDGELRFFAGLEVADGLELAKRDALAHDHQLLVRREVERRLDPGCVDDALLDSYEPVVSDLRIRPGLDARLLRRRSGTAGIERNGETGD